MRSGTDIKLGQSKVAKFLWLGQKLTTIWAILNQDGADIKLC